MGKTDGSLKDRLCLFHPHSLLSYLYLLLTLAKYLSCNCRAYFFLSTLGYISFYFIVPLPPLPSPFSLPPNIFPIHMLTPSLLLMGSGAGACSSPGSDPISYGNASSTLSFFADTITLEYDGGSVCPSDNSLLRSTIIFFTCNPDPSAQMLSSIGLYDSCNLILEMQTPLVCPQHVVECIATDATTGQVFDLSPLYNSGQNWPVIAGEYTYMLSVCGPLSSSDCPWGAAACQLKSSECV